MDCTMPSRSNCRANSTQSQRDKERPSLSGSSHAILTRYRATSGGKHRLASAAGLISQAIDAVSQETADPLAGVANGQTYDGSSRCQILTFVDQQKQPRPTHQTGSQL